MEILISCNEAVFPASLATGESLALYAVPHDYSPDGLYLARWGAKELEPIPACASAEKLLTLRLETATEGTETLVELYKSEGVSYAAN